MNPGSSTPFRPIAYFFATLQMHRTKLMRPFIIGCLILSLFSCGGSENIPNLLLDNSQRTVFAKAGSIFSLEKLVKVSSETTELIGEDLIFFAATDSVLVIAGREKGILGLKYDGTPIWHVTSEFLGTHEFNPLFYTFYDEASETVWAMTSDKRKLLGFNLSGELVKTVGLSIPHDNAILLEDGTYLLETLGLPTKESGMIESYLLSIVKDSQVVQGIKKSKTWAAEGMHYNYPQTLYRYKGEVYYARPHAGEVNEFDERGHSISTVATYSFKENEASQSLFSDVRIKNVLKHIADKNLVQPIWIVGDENRLFVSFDYNYENNFIVAGPQGTILNSNLLLLDSTVVAAPTLYGDDRFFLSYYPQFQHDAMQELPGLSFNPSKKWQADYQNMADSQTGFTKDMVLVVLKVKD